jgi:aspartyl-tRNA(Asn)/glutamyl-tRNA(Gln) amidotransferase subunit A
VPVEGVQPLAPSLDTVGPITRDVATCAAVQRVLADRPAEPAGPVRRVGVVPEVEELVVDADVRDVWRTVLAALEADGAELVEVPLPLAEVNRVTDTLLDAEAYAVHEALLTRRPGPDGWAPDVWKRLGAAKALASADVSAARRAGERWRERVRSVFDEVEVLVLPVLALRTPPRDPSRRRRISRTLLTNPWNLAGVPAGAVPAGVDYGGAPVGLQVVGPWDGEELVLAGMAAIERLRAAGTTPGSPPAS